MISRSKILFLAVSFTLPTLGLVACGGSESKPAAPVAAAPGASTGPGAVYGTWKMEKFTQTHHKMTKQKLEEVVTVKIDATTFSVTADCTLLSHKGEVIATKSSTTTSLYQVNNDQQIQILESQNGSVEMPTTDSAHKFRCGAEFKKDVFQYQLDGNQLTLSDPTNPKKKIVLTRV